MCLPPAEVTVCETRSNPPPRNSRPEKGVPPSVAIDRKRHSAAYGSEDKASPAVLYLLAAGSCAFFFFFFFFDNVRVTLAPPRHLSPPYGGCVQVAPRVPEGRHYLGYAILDLDRAVSRLAVSRLV